MLKFASENIRRMLHYSGIDGNESQKRQHRFLVEISRFLQVLETWQASGNISCEKENHVSLLITTQRAFSLDDPSLTVSQYSQCISSTPVSYG